MNNHRYFTHFVLAALATLLYVVPAHAAKKAQAADNGNSPADILTKIHATNQKEIQAGQFAEKHAKNKDVIAYAQSLVKEHTAADEKVMAYAKKYNIDLGITAAGMMAMNKTDLAHLTDMAKGEQFDNHFVQMMLDDHKKAIADLTQARDATGDAQLKGLINEILPKLKDHEDKAQKLLNKARL